MLGVVNKPIMLSVIMMKCRSAECRYVECRGANCKGLVSIGNRYLIATIAGLSSHNIR